MKPALPFALLLVSAAACSSESADPSSSLVGRWVTETATYEFDDTGFFRFADERGEIAGTYEAAQETVYVVWREYDTFSDTTNLRGHELTADILRLYYEAPQGRTMRVLTYFSDADYFVPATVVHHEWDRWIAVDVEMDPGGTYIYGWTQYLIDDDPDREGWNPLFVDEREAAGIYDDVVIGSERWRWVREGQMRMERRASTWSLDLAAFTPDVLGHDIYERAVL